MDTHLNKLIIELLKQKPDNVLKFINDWSATEIKNPAPQAQGSTETGNTEEAPAQTENAYEVKGEALNVETMNPEDCPKEDKGDWEQPEVMSDSDEEDDDVPALDDFRGQSKKLSGMQRASVSAEVFGSNNFKEEYVPTVVEKSEEAKARISTRLSQSFMFASLDEREKQIVLNAMKEHTYAKDDVVIKQGDDGEVLYCLDTGVLKCYRKMDKDAEYPGTFLKDYQPGEAFGELALLYNAPRAATIIANEASTCFSLDRDCFNSIVKDATVKRRERFEQFLNKIELLNELDVYEKGQLSDVLTVVNYAAGDVVIKQGETGTQFYLLEAGTADAIKTDAEGAEEIVFQYTQNDYFGELALLKDEPRAATIKATSALRVAWLDRGSFKRLLGPLESVLQRNTEKYSKFMKAD